MSKDNKTHELIKQMASEKAPKRIFSPFIRTVIFVCLTLVYIGVVAFTLYNPRPDWLNMYKSITFSLEQSIALFIGVLAAFISFKTSIPGEDLPRETKWVYGLIFITLIALVALGDFTIHSTLATFDLLKGMHCALDISVLAIPPLILIIYLVLKAAPTQPMITGLFAFLSVSAFGYFGVRTVCATDHVDHQMLSHILPIMIYTALGFWLGKKIFRW